MKKLQIALLGATGSIGKQTLSVIDKHSDIFELVAASVNSNIDELESIYNKYTPKFLAVADEKKAFELMQKVKQSSSSKPEIFAGEEANVQLCNLEQVDAVIIALSGMKAVKPLFACIVNKKRIGLANKECIVCAGELVNIALAKHGGKIYPIDSEQSAIFQCLIGTNKEFLSSLILTASGGPFRGFCQKELENVTPQQALKHPSWSMGTKITIDSATLANKGLEVIEAKFLFDVDPNQIKVVVHPQSVVHSMVEFVDGALIAQLGAPDMRLPIQYALTFPKRLNCDCPKMTFDMMKKLEFFEPDYKTFQCLSLAFDVLRVGASATSVYNAANEVAVELFLKNKISFLNIGHCIDYALQKVEVQKLDSVETAIECDQKARRCVLEKFA